MGTKGISDTSAAFVLSITAVVAFPTTLLAGWLLDKVKIHYATALEALFQLINLILLFYTQSIYMAIGFAVCFGTQMGLYSVLGGLIWPQYYGIKHLGSIRGLVMTATVIASSLGPIPFGIAYDAFGNYSSTITIMMLFPALGILIVLVSPKPKS